MITTRTLTIALFLALVLSNATGASSPKAKSVKSTPNNNNSAKKGGDTVAVVGIQKNNGTEQQKMHEQVLFGLYAMTDSFSQVPLGIMTYDGVTPDHVASGYAMSIFGRTTSQAVLVQQAETRSKKLPVRIAGESKPPTPAPVQTSKKAPAKGAGKTGAPPPPPLPGKASLGQYNTYKGFLSSPEEVLTTLAADASTPYNGIRIEERASHYSMDGQVVTDGIDLTSVNWTKVATTIMVAASAFNLPLNMTIDAKTIFSDYFGTVQNLSVLSVKVAYGVADDYAPKYNGEIDPVSMLVSLFIDEDWYAGMTAAKRRSERKLKAEKGSGHGKPAARSEGLDDGLPTDLPADASVPAIDEETPTEAPDEATAQEPEAEGPLVVSVEIGFDSPSSSQAQANDPPGTVDEDLLVERPLPLLNIRSYVMSNTQPSSEAFDQQRYILKSEGVWNYRGPGGGAAVVFSPVLVYVVLTLGVLITLASNEGYPYSYDIAVLLAMGQKAGKRLSQAIGRNKRDPMAYTRGQYNGMDDDGSLVVHVP